MAILGEKQFVERLKFFDGQRLFAADLDAMGALHREMRWLHNQSLHQPGVGRGFAVAGGKGAKAVAVQEGYAIDNQGREIVLTLPHTEMIPPVAGNNGEPAVYDLAVGYPGDDDLDVTETRQGLCVTPGAVRRREEPVFCWIEIDAQGQPRDGALKTRLDAAELIRLARVRILDCKLYDDVSITERRNARPPQGPHIGCGTAVPKTDDQDGFVWDEVPSGTIARGDLVNVKALNQPLVATIPTKSAGFRTPPSYFVEVRGNRIQQDGGNQYVIDGTATVTKASAIEFTVAIHVMVQYLSGADESLTIAEKLFEGWEITWMGVEG